MIKSLKRRVFYIIMVSISILVLGIILLYSFTNYTNTVRITRMFIERAQNGDYENKVPEPIKKESREKPDDKYIELEEEDIEEIQQHAKNHIRKIFIYCISGIVISLLLIYFVSRKLTEIIVKPVEKTFEKQKQFISDASHELKTPLSVIEANADVLETEIGNNKWLSYIQNEIESMDKMINQLLVLAKIENLDSIVKKEEFIISEEIEKTVSMFESLAFDKKIKIKTDIEKNIKYNGTKEDIEHVVSILIDNAIKHTEKEKNIKVELKKEKNNLIISVENYGKEIPIEEREKIFERFYRVDKARNRKEKRYGLGLAIAKSIVEKNNGKINVDYKNHYTVFEVIL